MCVCVCVCVRVSEETEELVLASVTFTLTITFTHSLTHSLNLLTHSTHSPGSGRGIGGRRRLDKEGDSTGE